MSKYDAIERSFHAHERRRKPKKIQGVQFIYHNGMHYLYKCKYAEPMIGMADTVQDIVKKRNDAIKNKVGPFILEGMNWNTIKNIEAFLKKIFFEMDGKVYWNVAYVTPRQIYYPGDVAEVKYKYAQVKFMGKTFMAHSIIWLLYNDVYRKDLIHRNGDNLDNRISNLI